MTTNQTIDGVLREQVERALDAIEQVGLQDKFIDYTFVRTVKQELRALLDSPPPSDWERGLEDSDGNELVTVRADEYARLKATQPQGAPVAILSGPDDSVCWTQDSTPKEHRKQVVLIEHADLLRLQGLASGADETVYQTRWCSLGEWEEWKTVSREKYERSDGQLFERRIVYAEQPAPVEVVGTRTPFEIEHDAEPGDEAAFRQWRQERLNPTRPARATPPPGTEPSGTHHDNDGLDDYRNTK